MLVKQLPRFVALLLALTAVLTACGGRSAGEVTPSPTEPTAVSEQPQESTPAVSAAPAETPAPEETPAPADTPAPAESVSPTPAPVETPAAPPEPAPTETPAPVETPEAAVPQATVPPQDFTVIGPVAVVYLDGYLYDAIDLGAVTEPYTYTVKGFSGLTNDIEVEHGRIRVCRADCPDKICVSQGWLENDFIPIACLPNSLIIQVYGANELGLDGMAG